MHINIQRTFTNDKLTLGALNITDVEHEPIFTLENPWLDNKPWISSIPAGDYCVNKRISKKFGECFEVYVVDERSDILIHVGNTEDDTSGCILVGMACGRLYNAVTGINETAVLQSKAAMAYLNELLKKADNITITIKD
tara:strand:- start:6513 stop:6929 length:417 start_codon:yes stop_codon:yes gene_type:complete